MLQLLLPDFVHRKKYWNATLAEANPFYLVPHSHYHYMAVVGGRVNNPQASATVLVTIAEQRGRSADTGSVTECAKWAMRAHFCIQTVPKHYA